MTPLDRLYESRKQTEKDTLAAFLKEMEPAELAFDLAQSAYNEARDAARERLLYARKPTKEAHEAARDKAWKDGGG